MSDEMQREGEAVEHEVRAAEAGAQGVVDAGATEKAGEADEDDDLISLARERLELDGGVSDVAIAASLAQISSKGDPRARWLAAFGSPLGKHLAAQGRDLNTALNLLQALAPRPPV
jgi:hypothetical protein